MVACLSPWQACRWHDPGATPLSSYVCMTKRNNLGIPLGVTGVQLVCRLTRSCLVIGRNTSVRQYIVFYSYHAPMSKCAEPLLLSSPCPVYVPRRFQVGGVWTAKKWVHGSCFLGSGISSLKRGGFSTLATGVGHLDLTCASVVSLRGRFFFRRVS